MLVIEIIVFFVGLLRKHRFIVFLCVFFRCSFVVGFMSLIGFYLFVPDKYSFVIFIKRKTHCVYSVFVALMYPFAQETILFIALLYTLVLLIQYDFSLIILDFLNICIWQK